MVDCYAACRQPGAGQRPEWWKLIPRLQRFYGGDPGQWLRLPLALIHWYADALAPLQAEECLRQMTIVAMGSGSMDQDEWKDIKRRWEETARDEEVQRITEVQPPRKPSKVEWLARMMSLGVPMDGIEGLIQEFDSLNADNGGEKP